jgi:hypothetical protein
MAERGKSIKKKKKKKNKKKKKKKKKKKNPYCNQSLIKLTEAKE